MGASHERVSIITILTSSARAFVLRCKQRNPLASCLQRWPETGRIAGVDAGSEAWADRETKHGQLKTHPAKQGPM